LARLSFDNESAGRVAYTDMPIDTKCTTTLRIAAPASLRGRM
jgi:hypothetical protein